MGLSRLILLILLAALIYRLWKRWRPRSAAARPVATGNNGQMLACAHCGMYIPEQDALRDGSEVYCCTEHQRAHRHA